MAFAGIPAAAMWALGGAAAGGVAAEASGEDWQKGALLGATGGLGLSSLLGAGAVGAAGAGSAATAEAAAGGLGAATATGTLGATAAPVATGVGTAVGGAGATTAVESAFLADMAKAGATNVAVGGAQQAAFPEPEVTMTNPHPFSLQGIDPNQVFALIQQLQSQRIA